MGGRGPGQAGVLAAAVLSSGWCAAWRVWSRELLTPCRGHPWSLRRLQHLEHAGLGVKAGGEELLGGALGSWLGLCTRAAQL